MSKGSGQGSGGGAAKALDSAVSRVNSVGVVNGDYLREGMRSAGQSAGAYAGATPAQATAIATGKVAATNSGQRLPPITVVVDQGDVIVKDGRHRLAAAAAAGATAIRANVVTYSRGRKVEREAVVSIQGRGGPKR